MLWQREGGSRWWWMMQCDATKAWGWTPGDLSVCVIPGFHSCNSCTMLPLFYSASVLFRHPGWLQVNLFGCVYLFFFFSLNSGDYKQLLTHCGSATCSGVAHSRNAYQQERVSAHMNELVLRYEAEVERVALLCLAVFLCLHSFHVFLKKQ